jgi:hypothetical protein
VVVRYRCLVEDLVVEEKVGWEAVCDENEQGIAEIWRDSESRNIARCVLVDFIAKFER